MVQRDEKIIRDLRTGIEAMVSQDKVLQSGKTDGEHNNEDDAKSYQQAYMRERTARLQAEKLLDEKTREVYSSLYMIEQQYASIMDKKKELELLFSISHSSDNQLSFNRSIEVFITSVASFLGAESGCCYVVAKQKIFPSEVCVANHEGTAYCKVLLDKQPKLFVNQALKKCLSEGQMVSWDLPEAVNDGEAAKILYVPVTRFKQVVAVCLFNCKQKEDIAEPLLNSLQTASKQISVMLERRDAQKKLEENYKTIKKAHVELKEAQNQLLQSEKMASLGQLAAGVAHEINNPVGFVLSNLETLTEYMQTLICLIGQQDELIQKQTGVATEDIDGFKEDNDFEFIVEDLKEVLTESSIGLKRVKDIVANLKSFARADGDVDKDIDINQCVKSTLKVVNNEIKYRADVDLELSDVAPVKGSETQLSQVLVNLLVNASQAFEERHGTIKVSTWQEDQQVCIRVSDDGCGIPEDIRKRIFDPFFTTKPVNVGTGLGLSISYGIIDKHGGSIDLESEVGVGTNFTIRLPATE